MISLRSGEVDIEGLGGGASAADDFAGPESRAEEGYPGIFQFTYSTEEVTLVSGLISVHTPL